MKFFDSIEKKHFETSDYTTVDRYNGYHARQYARAVSPWGNEVEKFLSSQHPIWRGEIDEQGVQ